MNSLLARQEHFSVPDFFVLSCVLVAAHGRSKLSAFLLSPTTLTYPEKSSRPGKIYARIRVIRGFFHSC